MSDGWEEWRRLHPLTPLLRGGRYLLFLVAVVGQQGLRQADGRAVVGAVVVGLPVAVLAGWLSWRATRFRLDGSELLVASGVLQKRDRRVPLPRVQSVDVVRPLVGRVLGLAELRLEVVGGGESEGRLAYLTDDDAVRLRAVLLSRVAGETSPEVAEPVERVLVQVPTGALVRSSLMTLPVLVCLVLPGVALAVALVDPVAAGSLLLGAVPLLLAVGGLVVRRLLADYGFSVAELPTGLRLRHGLLDKRTQTVPAGRVQTVRLREPLLWRRRGWVRVEVDVAGYAGSGEEQLATSTLLPVAPKELAEALVARVLGAGLPAAVAAPPASVRWRAPVTGPRHRVGHDARLLVTRRGVLDRTTDVVPLAKAQSLRTTQGPWQRRLGLASVHVDSAGRRLPGAVAQHRGAAEAERLVEELTTLARTARAS